jgi:hypothetical protein
MDATDDLDDFLQLHRPHGPLTGDATEPTPLGYMVEVSCSCGVVFMRWVTPQEAAVELLGLQEPSPSPDEDDETGRAGRPHQEAR